MCTEKNIFAYSSFSSNYQKLKSNQLVLQSASGQTKCETFIATNSVIWSWGEERTFLTGGQFSQFDYKGNYMV